MADKRAFDPFGESFPAIDLEARGRICVSVPLNFIPFLLSAINPLRFPDAWHGDLADRTLTQIQVDDLFARLVLHEECPDVPCPDCPDCPDVPGFGYDSTGQAIGEGSPDSEDETMGQTVTDVQIVNGTIRVFFGPCCYKDLGSIQDILDSGNESDIEPPWEEVNPGGNVYSACAKAKSIVDAVYSLVEIGWTQTDNAPWQYIGNVEDAFGYDLDNKHVVKMISSIMLLYFLFWDYASMNKPTQRQKIVSRVVGLFTDDSTGVPTESLYEQIKSAFMHEMSGDVYQGIFNDALNAIGRRDLDAIAKLGSVENASYDCSAPPEIPFGSFGADQAWRYGWDFRTSQGGWAVLDEAQTHWAVGQGFWGDSGTTQNYTNVDIKLPFTLLNNGSTITRAAVILACVGDENWSTGYLNVGTEDVQIITYPAILAVTGQNPAVAGQHEIQGTGDDALGATELQFQVISHSFHPDPGVQHDDLPENSHRIIAVMFAGTGPGPLAAPPAWPFEAP